MFKKYKINFKNLLVKKKDCATVKVAGKREGKGERKREAWEKMGLEVRIY